MIGINAKFTRANYNIGYLLSRVSEADVERSILEWLAWQGIFACKVDAGAKSLRGRAAGLARRLGAGRVDLARLNKGKSDAAQKGFPDIIGVMPGGRAIFLEIKAPEWVTKSLTTDKYIQVRPAGKPDEAQLRWLERAQKQGAIAGVAWSVEDAKAIIARHINPKETK